MCNPGSELSTHYWLQNKTGLGELIDYDFNKTTLSEAELWHTYTMLTDLEAVFGSLKSELGLRPVFHRITDRESGPGKTIKKIITNEQK